jgi:hypothetical protein
MAGDPRVHPVRSTESGAAAVAGVPDFVRRGALLGHLWMEGHLGVGDPLVNQGGPSRPAEVPGR